ncbi:MAG: hypothetical protein FGM27_07885 [Candidatus Omnitrophica bacterium]|nr:hypothetical protein [Candidatus Omnitrophota bacterium]
MNSEPDFNQDIKKFIQMLKRLLRSHPISDKLKESGEGSAPAEINMNVFIFPLIPLTPEEMDELEDIYDAQSADEVRGSEEFSTDLTESDLDFLRKYGIRF